MVRRALLVVLALTAGSPHVDAQRLTCSTILPGDTASQVAIRLTGAAGNRHRAWFQIVDPGTRRIVAKSQYDRIHAGWRACVTQAPFDTTSRAGSSRTPPSTASTMPWGVVASVIRDADATLALWLAVVVAAAFVWNACDEYLTGRRRTLEAMRRFGNAFVREFERPLLQPLPAAPPIRSRLRARPERGRLEILLAPGEGVRYPNLSDHKANLAYDVVRVLQLLRDQPFACAPPYAEGAWVVVPFHFQGPARAGLSVGRPGLPERLNGVPRTTQAGKL